MLGLYPVLARRSSWSGESPCLGDRGSGAVEGCLAHGSVGTGGSRWLTGMLVVTNLTESGVIPPGASLYTVLVGPEGGFKNDEMPLDAVRIRPANRVLRTETAAMVGESAVLKELDR